MRIDQFVHTLSYGDAISSEVLSIQRVFKESGIESDIFAINVHPRYKQIAIDYREYKESQTQTSEVILHYSLGSSLNDLYKNLTKTKRSAIYHNITPAKWFKGVNPKVVADIERGISELGEICRASDRLIADSTFNASELNEHVNKEHVDKIFVLPLCVDPNRWSESANSGITQMLKSSNCLNLLHVGRVVPNKKLEDILKIFYFLNHYINKESKLWFVGIDTDSELYSFSLKRMINEFSLNDSVKFTGGLSDSEVRAFYEASSVYITMSEHEGFCLPVCEAMNFGLPVISYNEGALPETIADGGIIVNQKEPALIAELVNEIYSNNELRLNLIAKGKKRVEEMSYQNFKTNLLNIFK